MNPGEMKGENNWTNLRPYELKPIYIRIYVKFLFLILAFFM